MNILIDDVREAYDGIICRDYEAALLVLTSVSISGDYYNAILSLDHDLGGEPGTDGIDILMWAKKAKIHLPRTIYLVTENPIGRKNMRAALVNDLGYMADFSGKVFTHD
jgi:hypothetical protein